MNTGDFIFEHVCRVPEPEREIASLTDEELAELIEYVQNIGKGGGIPGALGGLADVEAAERFVRIYRTAPPA